MKISGHIPVWFDTKVYLFTQETEVEHLLLKIRFCEGYPPLGLANVEKWVVLKKKHHKSLGIEKTFQKIYMNLYCDDGNIYTDRRNR
jgi:hypothetical protein